MSTTIDTKVAQLKFDNAQFEKGIDSSIKDVEKLNKALKLDQAASGVQEVSKAIKGMDFNPVSEGITLVTQKFSAWEQIAIGAARRIGENLEQFVVKTFKELSGFNNLTEGYEKYDTILESTNVLVSATGKSLEEVEDRIETLAWYSDETSYNLNHMTDALSKFANAGADIDEATYAIQGIASWAAASGVNAQKASSAFYNLSQAMGVGYLGGADAKSLELLNMMTPEFKKIAIAAGLAQGKIKEVGEGIYSGGDVDFSVESMKESLKDKWLDTDVLVQTLNEYGKYSKDLLAFMDEYPDKYDSASEAMADFDDQLKATGKYEEYALSRNAFLMAQQAKTFKDAIDATKDASSTKWYKIVKSIVGDLEEAKELWTDVTEELYDIFVSPLDTLSDAFKKWHDLGGRNMMLEGLSTFYNNVKAIFGAISEAFSNVFGSDKTLQHRLLNITAGFRDFMKSIAPSEETLGHITKFVTVILENVKWVLSFVRPIFDIIKKIGSILLVPLKTIATIIYSIADVLGYAIRQSVEFIIRLVRDLKKYIPLKTIQLTWETIVKIHGAIKNLVKVIVPQLKGFFGALFSAFDGVTSTVRSTIKQSHALWKVFDSIHKVFKKLLSGIQDLTKRFANGDLTGRLSEIGGRIGNWLGEFFNRHWPKVEVALEWIVKQIPKVINIFKSLGNILKNVFGWIGEHVAIAAVAIKDFVEETKPLEHIGSALQTAGQKIGDFFANLNIGEKASSAVEKVKEFFASFKKEEVDTSSLDETNEKLENQLSLLDRLKEIWHSFLEAMSAAWAWIKEKAVAAWEWIDAATGGALTKLIDSIKGLFDKLGSGEITIWDIFLKILSARVLFSSIIRLVELIKNPHTLVGTLKQAISGIGKSIAGIGDAIAGMIKSIGKAVKTKLMTAVFHDIAKALLEIAIAMLLLSRIDIEKLEILFPMILGFMLGLGKVAKDFLKGTSALADATGGLSEAKALKSISKTFSNIAKAVLILVAALWVASKIDEDEAKSGMATIIMLMFMLRSMVKTGTKGNFGDTGKQIKQISKAMLILVAAVFLFGSMDSDRLAAGLITVVLLLKMFEKFIKVYNDSAKGATRFDGVGKSFKQISKAILLMVASVFLFGSMPTDKLFAGVTTVVLLLAAMLGVYAGIAASRKVSGGMTADTWKTITNGFVKMAAALIIVAAGIMLFAIFPASHILAAGATMSLILVAMAAVYAIVSLVRKNIQATDPKIFNKLAGGFVILAAALLIVANGILIMGLLPVERVATAGGIMSIILIVMAMVYAMVAKVNLDTKGKLKPAQFAGFAAGMVILAAAMSAVAAGILLIGMLPIDKMIVAGIIMASVLGLLAVLMNLMGGKVKGNKVASDNTLIKTGNWATSILAIAAAVGIIAAAMVGLGQLGWEGIFPAVIGLATIVIALFVLSKVSSGLHGAGMALLEFFGGLAIGLVGVGVAVLLIAAAATIFNSSLSALALGLMLFAAGGEEMEKGAQHLGNALSILVRQILRVLAEAIIEGGIVLVAGFVKLCVIFLKGLWDLCKAVNEELPKILEELSITLAIILAWISDILPGILEWLSESLHTILDWLVEEIPIIFGYLTVIIPELAIGIVELIIQVLEAVADYIDENATRITWAIYKFIAAIFKLLWHVLTDWTQIEEVKSAFSMLKSIGEYIFNGLWDGMKGIWEGISGWFSDVRDGIGAFVSDLWDAVTGAEKAQAKVRGGAFFSDTRIKNLLTEQELDLLSTAWYKVGDDFESDTERKTAMEQWIANNRAHYTDEEWDAIKRAFIVFTQDTLGTALSTREELDAMHFVSENDAKRLNEERNAKNKPTEIYSKWDELYDSNLTDSEKVKRYGTMMDSEVADTIAYFNNLKRFDNRYKDYTFNATGMTGQVKVSSTDIGEITITATLGDMKEYDDFIAFVTDSVNKKIDSVNGATGTLPSEAKRTIIPHLG